MKTYRVGMCIKCFSLKRAKQVLENVALLADRGRYTYLYDPLSNRMEYYISCRCTVEQRDSLVWFLDLKPTEFTRNWIMGES